MKILNPNNARTVFSADGTLLEAYSWGNPQHPALVLIHGGMQSGLSFSPLVESALAQEYFLVTFDLRGHFRSEKPSAADAYSLKMWADDLHAVISTYKLQRPVVLGWSLGGCVIYSYLHYYQPTELSGIIFTASPIDLSLALPIIARDPAVLKMVTDIASTDEELRREAVAQFVDILFAAPVAASKYAETLGYNFVAPPFAVQSMIAGMSKGFGEPIAPFLQRLSLPVLFIQGGKDQICPAEFISSVATEAGIQLELFENSGHSTFYEEPERFQATLSTFLKRVYEARLV